jgi:hypothetical protein
LTILIGPRVGSSFNPSSRNDVKIVAVSPRLLQETPLGKASVRRRDWGRKPSQQHAWMATTIRPEITNRDG